MSSGESDCVVIDGGSDSIRAGLEADYPSAVFPAVVGTIRYAGMIGVLKRQYVGEDAICKRGILKLTYPLEEAYDFDMLSTLWSYIFEKLSLEPADRPVLLAQRCFSSDHAMKISEQFFEGLSVPSLCIQNCEPLCLYTAGRTSGLVIDSGSKGTSIVPVFEGFPLLPGVRYLHFGGKDVTEYLRRKLETRYAFSTTAEVALVKEMKEKVGDVIPRDATTTERADVSYELPDGTMIDVGQDSYTLGDVFFNPHAALGLDIYGIHDTVHQSVRRCDAALRPLLLQNILLAGGNTMFAGLENRLMSELRSLYGKDEQLEIISSMTPPRKDWQCWMGGSILSSLSTFGRFCVTKEEYEECGRGIARAKWLLAEPSR